MRKFKIYFFIITLSLIYCNILYGEESALSPQLPEISKENILKHIIYLASKETEGRLMGSSGSQKTREYIEGLFSEYGLVPPDKYSGYLQSFEIKVRHLSSDNHLSIGSKIFEQKWNFIPLYFSGEGEVSGVTCLSNYGLNIDAYKRCKDKIVVVFDDRTIIGKNIVGLIKGKSDEVIIISAHYDHLGRDKEGNIFYGADDNGTGVAALLEIASAFAKIKDKLKRSILFIAFDGEEWGLKGAKAYVENPAFPYKKTVAMLNMDTIGRNKPDEIYILGSLKNPDLKGLNDRVNEKIGLKLLDTIEFAFDYGSDHYPFYEKGIPSIDYTSSYHEDFHKITDTVEKVNIDKVSKVAELVFKVTYEIAATDIKFDKPKKVYVPFPKK